jgi:hypothetical protein
MKSQLRFYIVLALVLGMFPLIQNAHAAKGKKADADSTDSSSSSEYSSDITSWGSHMGLGFSTPSKITGGDGAVTGWVPLSRNWGLQPYFTIPATSPFELVAGAIAKYKIAENASHTAGFHIGGGTTLGDIAGGTNGHVFGWSLDAVAGIHVQMPGASNVMIHLDGGPVFLLVDGNSNFAVDPISTALGLSVIYMF